MMDGMLRGHMGSGERGLEQMAAILDGAPVAVYVSALQTWELLYANQPAKDMFLKGISGAVSTCYEAAGFLSPCPFCRVGDIASDQLTVREFSNPRDGRVYRISGKQLDWGGVPAHVEYIVDITSQKREEERSRAFKEELESAISRIPVGICVYQADGERIRPQIQNPAFFGMMEFSEEHRARIQEEMTFLGVHPDDLPALKGKLTALLTAGGNALHVCRLFNDRKGEYRWIRIEASMATQEDGKKLLYAAYSDVSEQMRLERELKSANNKMQDIINSIPGGVAVYQVSDIFKTIYFSDGVPALSGYTVEEYRELTKLDASRIIYSEDTAILVEKAREAIRSREAVGLDFRTLHRDGHIVWVHVQMRMVGEEDGYPFLHCVFHNISELKEAQLEMDHLVNSIPGGIATYQIEGTQFKPIFFSDGVMALTGHIRTEYEKLVENDAIDLVYESDKDRVLAAAKTAVVSGKVLDVSYRIRHKDGHLVWVHLNGRRIGPLTENAKFYAVFTGMSAQARLFQSIANETADGIYVIDKGNYDLLYVNESKHTLRKQWDYTGQKCYEALQGKDAPCEFCNLTRHPEAGGEFEMEIPGSDRIYLTKYRETDWNGIPAYVQFVRDVTEDTRIRKEKQRLEQYFQTLIRNLPGGVAVIHDTPDGVMVPEFLSKGFSAMVGMDQEETWEMYRQDAMAGVHPEDGPSVRERMRVFIHSGERRCEMEYRLQKGGGGFLWVKNSLSLIQSEGGEARIYATYYDVTKVRKEQSQLRQQYKELLMQHYRTPSPNALMIGHCNVTRSRILEMNDFTGLSLLETFGSERESFFRGIASFIPDGRERQAFLDTYLNKPLLAAYQEGETEKIEDCFMKLAKDTQGCYVRVKVNLVTSPDTGELTGILTITDTTEQTIQNRILHELSVTGSDFVVDVDLSRDRYTILSYNQDAVCIPPLKGCYSQLVEYMQAMVVPKDKERYANRLVQDSLVRKLEQGSYSFSYSIMDDKGDIRTKNMTVSAIDLRLGRVCLLRTDITDSLREQQGLLNMIAYTFDLAGFIDIGSQRLTMHTRETVLENLPPFVLDGYEKAADRFYERYQMDGDADEIRKQFRLKTMQDRLAKAPTGYDFVFSYHLEGEVRYKQVNVLWGDENHRTLCLVRADVTDMLAAERRVKEELETALEVAREANRAKSDFLSAMSHDIRTPMNAIMGMTTLASAYLNDPQRVRAYLGKIAVSSKHLLSLINDVLDMSKIEQSKITLNCVRVSMPELIGQLAAILTPQAREKGVSFGIYAERVVHERFYGDMLRINQILINLLSNAVKFTLDGGMVRFCVEEVPPERGDGLVGYRFTVSDTGIGMNQDFLKHLFEPFVRSRESAMRRIEGTGLGLSITKGLVDIMEGTISVESRPGLGTTFRVGLEFEPVPERRGGLPCRVCSVLVVEDEEPCRKAVGEALSRAGIQLFSATGGEEAIQALASEGGAGFDMILLDSRMPGMDGPAVAEKIRGELGMDLPIVMMVSPGDEELCDAAGRAGIRYFMPKPFFLSTFRKIVADLFSGQEGETALEGGLREDGIFEGRCFLVAEDNQINAEIIRELMAMYHAKTVVKPDGRQVVQAFSKAAPGTYDAIFMDIQMPEMDGYEASRAIRALDRPDAGTIPIIAMTANAFSDDVQKAMEAGMDVHVAKPIDLDVLKEALIKVLGA